MTRTQLKPLLLAFLTAAALAACKKDSDDHASSAADQSPSAQEAVATVNGATISKGELDEYLNRKRAAEDASANPQEALDELINIELINQEALKAGFDKRPDIQAEFERRKKNLIVDAYILEWVRDAKFSDEQLKAKYDQEVARLPKNEYRARHILVKAETDAEDVIKSLSKGGDFAALAKEKSIDPSGQRGGELGWFRPSAMVPEFAAAVAQMNVGDTSDKPVQSQYGWHVIQLEEKRESKQDVPPFDKVKDRMRTALAGEAVHNYVQELRAKSKVDIKSQP